jgi:hypothetical protein
MKRPFKTLVAAIALALTVALPASAGAQPGAVKWLCTPLGEEERTFVSAAAPAFHGINRANERAGFLAFNRQFQEECRVVLDA